MNLTIRNRKNALDARLEKRDDAITKLWHIQGQEIIEIANIPLTNTY